MRNVWSLEEDDRLMQLRAELGPRWVLISRLLGSRNPKQCAERWNNNLRPNINRDALTETEQDEIARLYTIHGSKWAKIARCLPGRTSRIVKNYWYNRGRKESCRIRARMVVKNLLN